MLQSIDLTHKEFLQSNAIATVGKISADWLIATIVIVVWDVEDVEITIVDWILLCCRRVIPGVPLCLPLLQ
jgi:hypothetical protein